MFEVIQLSAPLADWAILIARVIFGVAFIYYGYPKIKDLRANAEDFAGMGFKPGWLWGTIVGFLEFFGGILMIVGIFTGILAVGYIIHMGTGALWKITKTDKPFTDWSYDLLLLALALVFLAAGAGAISLSAVL